jgi:flavin-dependent dehydrogenase
MTPVGRVHDVLVAGGGPAGAVTALVLARAGRRVLLADRAPARWTAAVPLGETLPPVAGRLLGDLGLGDAFRRREAHLPCYGILSSWGSPALFASDPLADPDGPGWRLDRAHFDRFLRSAARDAGAELRTGPVRKPRRDGSGWSVEVAGAPVQCSWLVDATGRRAVLARALGAPPRRLDRLVATVATVRSQATGDQDGRTLVEAVPDGWWYTALLVGGARTVAFLTDANLAPRELRRPAGYLAQLARTTHLRSLLNRHAYRLDAGPVRVAAHGGRLDPPCQPGWLAVGDTALAVDPLSGQGLLTALHTGLLAGRALDAQLRNDPTPLERYRAQVAQIADAYQRDRADSYAQEQRWPSAPFWTRRFDAATPWLPHPSNDVALPSST